MPIGYEAKCGECGETFNPASALSLIHEARLDGRFCGGLGSLQGSWSSIAEVSPPPAPNLCAACTRLIVWEGDAQCWIHHKATGITPSECPDPRPPTEEEALAREASLINLRKIRKDLYY